MAKTVGRITEKDFRQQVLDLARLQGWKCYFTWSALHSPAGFPDLVLVKPPSIVFAELKGDGKQLTNVQAEWIWILQKCRTSYIRVYVWYPSDWDSIVKVLDGY